jgi:iron complex outermembrane receptor protein
MLIIGALGSACLANAGTPDSLKQSTDSSGAFELGRIVVTGRQASAEKLTNQVDAKKMEERGATNVAQALDLLPGVAVNMLGARYETGVYVRGFDLRQVPLYLDGVPQYVPYDGYVDLARFTTFDLSEVRVEKGYSSVLYGPNAMGGAINLVSRKPLHQLEFDATLGAKGYKDAVSDTTWLPRINGNELSLNLGSKLTDKVYLMAGASGLYLDAYRLSQDFNATKYQVAGERNQSYHRDAKVSAKIGFTPYEASEYALSYMYQHGEKGGPLYAGPDATITPRYWLWPYWDKQSLYFTSRTPIGSLGYVKVPLYYDQFKNSLYSYDDATYRTFKKPYAFKSWYDDYTLGGGFEAGTGILPLNDLRIAGHYKRDLHTELNSNDTSKNALTYIFVDETKRTFIDHTSDIGIEDGLRLFDNKLSVNAGASFDHRESERADNYFKYHFVTNPVTKATTFIPDSIAPFAPSIASAWNAQGRVGYNFLDGQNLSLSISRKTRFPTIKDRYSYKLGTAYPNADLKPEAAVHYDFGYGGRFDFARSSIEVQCDLFYSHLYDAIQSVGVVKKTNGTDSISQSQNVGEATIGGRQNAIGNTPLPGIELGVDYTIIKDLFLAKSLNVAASYSYAEKNNITNPAIKFTDVPTQKGLLSIKWSPIERSYLLGSFEWNSERWVDSKGARSLAGYNLLNFKVCAGLSKNVSLEAGITNALDANYSLQDGYPEEGRSYFANMRIGFSFDQGKTALTHEGMNQ